MKMFLDFYQYVLLFLLLATSGFPFFYSNQEYIVIGVLLSLIYMYISKGNINVGADFVSIIFLLCSWELFQGFFNGNVVFRQIIGTALRLSFGYLVLKSLGINFIEKFVKTIKFFASISLIFYALFFVTEVTQSLIKLSSFITPIFEAGDSYRYHSNIIFFNFHGFELTPKRNSGPFWEPGAFSVFLILAVIFDYFKKGNFLWRKNLPLLVALVTTMSTAGYITILVVLFLISLTNSQSGYLKRVVFFLLVTVIGYQLVVQLDFMGSKIKQNIDLAEVSTGSRFGSALADFKLIVKNPIMGYGRNLEAMYGVSFWDTRMMHRNNGVTKLVVTWGIMSLFIFYRFWVSTKTLGIYYRINKGGLILFLVIILSGFSQGIFQYPFFLGILFWYLPFKHTIRRIKI